MNLKAGVLSYVLAIGIVISAGLSALILYVYYKGVAYKTYQMRNQVLQNLETAVDISRAQPEEFELDRVYTHDLYGTNRDSISITRRKWGVFDHFRVVSFLNDVSYEKQYLLGFKGSEETKSPIYLQDDGRPLSLVGDTKIEGDPYLPLAGVQSAYIRRVGYQNKELLTGEQLRSKKELPEVELEEVFDYIDDLQGERVEIMGDSTHSFLDKSWVVEGFDVEMFYALEGNIVIKASKKVVLDSLASTKDIIVYAPTIEIKNGFEGSGQFFSEDSLLIRKNVILNYPSVLASFNWRKPAFIEIGEGSEVTGWILMDGERNTLRQRIIYLEDGVSFTGFIYCNGMVETYGDVVGGITTRRFLVRTFSAVYENYLFNASITGGELTGDFLMPSQWFYTPEARILKYLD